MRCDLHGMQRTASFSWIMARSSKRESPRAFSPSRENRAHALSSLKSFAEATVQSRFLEVFFNWELIRRYFPAILSGVTVTIEIAVAVVITGIALGLMLALARSFRVQPVSALIVLFADIFRALPPLVLVLLVYFGLPNVGINLPSFAVLWLVLSLV